MVNICIHKKKEKRHKTFKHLAEVYCEQLVIVTQKITSQKTKESEEGG